MVEKLFAWMKSSDGPGIHNILVNWAGAAGEIKMIVDTDVDI